MTQPPPPPATVETSRIVGVLPTPLPLANLAALTTTYETTHGPGLVIAAHGSHYVIRTPGTVCGCMACDQRDRADLARLVGSPWYGVLAVMIVCPECGDKRCPHAADHARPCPRTYDDTGVPGGPGACAS